MALALARALLSVSAGLNVGTLHLSPLARPGLSMCQLASSPSTILGWDDDSHNDI